MRKTGILDRTPSMVRIQRKGGSSVGIGKMRDRRAGHILRWASQLTPMGVIEESKQGIRGRKLKEIQDEANFSNEEWSRYLKVAWRTILRYREQNALLDSASSERALLVAQIVEQGREVFGGDATFRAWLALPSRALDGKSPSELLDTTTGMHLIKSELVRIEHGVF